MGGVGSQESSTWQLERICTTVRLTGGGGRAERVGGGRGGLEQQSAKSITYQCYIAISSTKRVKQSGVLAKTAVL